MIKRTQRLKKIAFIVLILIFILQGRSYSAQESASTSPGSKIISTFKYSPLNWDVPQVGKDVIRVVLDNGMILYLKEDRTLPLITVQGLIRTGSIYEKKEQHGVAELTGMVLRTGGTKFLSPDELNRELEYMGATLETSIGEEYGYVYLDVLSRDIDKGLELLSQVLRYPRFAEDKIDLAKTQLKEKIRRKNDDPEDIARREFYKAVYKDHPYGWELEWDVIKNISRKCLQNWHKTYFHPNNIMLAIYGDFDIEEMIRRVKIKFGDWEKAELLFPSIPKVKKSFRQEVNLAVKDLNQTHIRFGHLGIERTNKDRYAVEVMNFILGGGDFGSRITQKVRSDEGLAYHAGSYFFLDRRDLGVFVAICQTKSETTHRAIDLMLSEIRRITEEEVSEKELAWAKDSIINSFIFDFVPPRRIVTKLMFLEYNSMPSDFYKTYLDNIRAVTREDVLKVARKYLHPDNNIFVIVGNPKNFDQSLEDLGDIKEIDLKTLPVEE